MLFKIFIVMVGSTLSGMALGEAPLHQQEAEEQSQQEQKDARQARKAGAIIPYAKLKKKIEKETGGRIIGQRLRKTGTGWMYELRLRMGKGHIRYMMVEGATGKIIRRAG